MNLKTHEPYPIPSHVAAEAEEHWDLYSRPLLRQRQPGEAPLILDWSSAQEKPVLLSDEPPAMLEEYGQLAAEADYLLPPELPDRFSCAGDEIAKVSRGFHDVYGDYCHEVTIEKLWHATLIQYWLDAENVPICIQASEAMRLGSAINDHASLAIYSFDRTIRYAVFKEMGIRHDIRIFVRDYWEAHGKLPVGVFTLPSGVKITWLA